MEQVGDGIVDGDETLKMSPRLAKVHGCRGLAGVGRPGLIKAGRNSLPQTKIARVTYVADF